MKTLRDIDVKGKNVLVRVDYNVPLARDEEGNLQVESDLRIRASLPTLMYLRDHEAKKIILISHLGRPDGYNEDLSLRPVAERLAMLLAEEAEGVVAPTVDFIDDLAVTGVNLVGDERRKIASNFSPEATPEASDFSTKKSRQSTREAIDELPNGSIVLLENLRFDKREKANDEGFAREIIEATGAEIFVQDGFAVTHRAHTSTDAIAKLLPSVAGFLVEKEVKGLGNIQDPEKPFVVIIGGAKIEDKEPLIEEFLPKADRILVGGKIAADGYNIVDGYKGDTNKIYVAEDFDEDASGAKLDIGPISVAKFLELLSGAKTVLWNGVLGKTEDPAFATSSEMVARFLGEQNGIKTIICGGDTTGFVEGLMEKEPELEYDLISTGGGAALEFLLGKRMPGLEVLE